MDDITERTTARYGSDGDALRSEDIPLLTGAGRFTDDISLPGQAYGAFVRSPVAHGVLRGVDDAAALAMPGVQRGRRVNKMSGPEKERVPERHDATDLD